MRLNRLRTTALALIFLAFLIMYLGVFSAAILPFALVIGTILIMVSVFIYFRVGAMSMKIPTLECPNCHRMTKVMGMEDGCMYCGVPIRIEMDEDENLYAVQNGEVPVKKK
ncbi:DUF2614 family zinc ribbon-containing protein [Tumebacillus permanentifrigoris]|jgi:hypothetical protein|uniref:Zinc ribbon protein n=1 Tax=Tumebacillus permanentifrigoris TaxID=378543 RepID=A0A316D9F5_9BACL|nr:DUF2614 family zinc ribbon-containing protein [Tumebacillus permanentifrigoris]PWK13805.1 zinc ribbon protein [Tumebacillus permanentifrigoris]